ncbi:hypothetical protein [Pseudomonas sp. QTF5]|uniref:hypothetical protein n=1 Tax=Pseudomonas sp. QTF5 TaxID=1435425 RepID=UPI0004B99C6B|nr:hypothetical protein [Pseudomonas sp. QTF5]
MRALTATLGGLGFYVSLMASFSMTTEAIAGSIIIEDKDGATCTLPAPPAESGQTWQYEFPNAESPCSDNNSFKITFVELPSATTILLTDDRSCSKKLDGRDDEFSNNFWFELKTNKKHSTTRLFEVDEIDTFQPPRIIDRGLELKAKQRLNQNAPIRDKLSCVRITASSPEVIKREPVRIIPNEAWNKVEKESNSDFTCAGDQVMLAREHRGDENGPTLYLCGTAESEPPFTLTDKQEVEVGSEEDSYYLCPGNKVLYGRYHMHDETKPTSYRCASIVDANNKPLNLIRSEWSDEQVESESNMQCPPNEVMIGRQHEGDENGKTRIRCTKLTREQIGPSQAQLIEEREKAENALKLLRDKS